MAVKIEKGGWFLIFAMGLGITGYALNKYGLLDMIMPSAKVRQSADVGKVELPQVQDSGKVDVAAAAIPASQRGCDDKPEVRFYLWAWNAQMGLMFANGGPQATKGSLMCGKNVNLRMVREDDSNKMQEALVAFATDLKSGNANPSKGAYFVAIMGDGAATFLKGLNDTLRKIGPEYTAKVVGSAGYSRGEDKFMGPAEWKRNPQTSRGGFVAGVLRDGDWNIAQKWLGDNGLCNNPDEKTYDPGCLNWVNSSDYIDAGEKYISNYCETRPIVQSGKKTGESRKVCVNGVVTWTPGDVNVARKRGGLVAVASTREYSSQMPNTIIGIDKWMQDNRPIVEGMLEAMFQGGDQIKSYPQALKYASGVSASVYNEYQSEPGYWEKYYKGVVEPDKMGTPVELGGSSVNNLADNILLFGMAPNTANIFAATYKTFGDIVSQQYPDLLASYDAASKVVDTSYIEAIARRNPQMAPAAMPQFSTAAKVENVVSRRSWNITFDTGQATFTAGTKADLEKLTRDLLVAGNTMVEIHGHTDAVGGADSNQTLSEARAFSVKKYLEGQSSVSFPEGRLRVFSHGQANPIASNATPEGRAKNRRVEIVIGTSK